MFFFFTFLRVCDEVTKHHLLKISRSHYGALHDLVPCAQLKKREKNPWRSVTFSKVAG